MRRVYQTAALIICGLGIWVMTETRHLQYSTQLGPGPGFFPFWLGLAVAGLAVGWFGQVTFRPVPPMPTGFVPGRSGVVRILAIIGALAACGLLIEIVGFQLTMFGFLFFLLIVLGRRNLLLTVIISLIGSFGLRYAFNTYLQVYLPPSSIELLRRLGF